VSGQKHEKRVDTHRALLGFEAIRSQGEKVDGAYCYEGFTATTDYDGYTLYITDNRVTLTLFFHNKYDVQFDNERDLDSFLRRLYAVAKTP
jgi:hypothetical protein